MFRWGRCRCCAAGIRRRRRDSAEGVGSNEDRPTTRNRNAARRLILAKIQVQAAGFAGPPRVAERQGTAERIAPPVNRAAASMGSGTFWAIPAGERKIPEPIVIPTTSATELQSPSVRGSLLFCMSPNLNTLVRYATGDGTRAQRASRQADRVGPGGRHCGGLDRRRCVRHAVEADDPHAIGRADLERAVSRQTICPATRSAEPADSLTRDLAEPGGALQQRGPIDQQRRGGGDRSARRRRPAVDGRRRAHGAVVSAVALERSGLPTMQPPRSIFV